MPEMQKAGDLDDRARVWERAISAMAGHPVIQRLGPVRIARLAGLADLWRVYSQMADNGGDFDARLLEALGVGWRVTEGDAAQIPATGPLLVVGNHPTGGAEGLIAQALLGRRRDDWRVIGNQMVATLPEYAARQIGVGLQADPGRAMIAAVRHLRAGGSLLMFPAGTVAHWQAGRGYAEAPWHPSAARLARLCGAAVQPLQFHAATTLRWKLLSAISRPARTVLLPRELLAQRGRTVDVAIQPLLTDPAAIATYFAARA